MQDIHSITSNNMAAVGGRLFSDRRLIRQQGHHHTNQLQALKCPRCESSNTKFCYYNNYNLSQPRHFCKNCRRYWTKGGVLRNVPVGGGCRKSKKKSTKRSTPPTRSLSSSESSSNNKATVRVPDTENYFGEFTNLINNDNDNRTINSINWSGGNGHMECGDRVSSGGLDLTVTIDDLLLNREVSTMVEDHHWVHPTVENEDHQGLFDFTSTVDYDQDYWTQQRSTFDAAHTNYSSHHLNDHPLFLP